MNVVYQLAGILILTIGSMWNIALYLIYKDYQKIQKRRASFSATRIFEALNSPNWTEVNPIEKGIDEAVEEIIKNKKIIKLIKKYYEEKHYASLLGDCGHYIKGKNYNKIKNIIE